ncbi:MAG: magnesium transporter [Gammaproteobacteria bacterium]|jgi:magnesium transporter|nr:magnesium and cobalt transport protein CorA [Gammaproteobacteria bacterium]MEA3141846.1 magnesium transporter [Gammaproteobacteria bacterium]
MLISCAAYQDGTKLGDIALAQVPEYLHRPQCFVWVALFEPAAAELTEMQKLFDLHPLAVEDALTGHQRPKVEEYGDCLFTVLHLVEPEGAEYRLGELAIFAGPHYVLSVRRKAQKGFSEVRVRCERQPQLLRQGPGFVLYALIDAVVDRYFPILDSLEDELDTIEQRIFAPQSKPRENIESLYALKQRLMVMKHSVAPLLEGISNLSGARVPALCARLAEYFRDVYDHLQRLNQTADSIRDTIATAISVNLSIVTLQENETMKRLAAYAALLAVPTMIAGIYGMNFEHMPELKWRYGYALSLLFMGAIDVYLYFRFKKAQWL